MKSVFIIQEEQIFECSRFTEHTGHFVNKIKVTSDKTEKQEYQKQNFYKLSLWEKFKFFGITLLPKKGKRYEIIRINNRVSIQKI